MLSSIFFTSISSEFLGKVQGPTTSKNNNRILKHEGNFSNYYERFGLEKLKIINNRIKNDNYNTKIVAKNINKKRKLSFKDTYDLKNLPVQIEKLEKELKEYETILNDRDLFKNDRKTFDKATTQITTIKKIINESENKWLELQILKDEINNP